MDSFLLFPTNKGSTKTKLTLFFKGSEIKENIFNLKILIKYFSYGLE
jgi:hypothetical protein